MKFLIIGIVFVLLLAGGSFAAFTVGKGMGFSEGEEIGKEAGLKTGSRKGKKQGREEGFSEGKIEGFKEGSREAWAEATSETDNKDDFRIVSRKIRPVVKCIIAAQALDKNTRLFDDKLSEINDQRKISPLDFGQAIGIEKGLIQGYLRAYETIYTNNQVRDFYFDIFERQRCEQMR